jgi:hypothetical protein
MRKELLTSRSVAEAHGMSYVEMRNRIKKLAKIAGSASTGGPVDFVEL